MSVRPECKQISFKVNVTIMIITCTPRIVVAIRLFIYLQSNVSCVTFAAVAGRPVVAFIYVNYVWLWLCLTLNSLGCLCL